jgi:prepilin-type N-terminal cleavage/methylation domain-containing protein
VKKQKGFALIELLIVVAIILIIAAIAIPNLIRSKMAANESSSVASLRTINRAEVTYNNSYLNTYGTLVSLGPGPASCTSSTVATSTAACLIDNHLASRTKSGYNFTIAGTGTSVSYSTKATPQAASTGTRQFCSDVNLELYYSLTSNGCAVGTSPL